MKLHPQVRIVESGTRHPTYLVEVLDGETWKEDGHMPMARGWAEQRARWLSDVLEHARDAALEEAANMAASVTCCGIDARSLREDIVEHVRALKGVRDA